MVSAILTTPTKVGPSVASAVGQLVLIKGLERTRNHSAARDIQICDALKIVLSGELGRQVSVVGHQREAGIDDVDAIPKRTMTKGRPPGTTFPTRS